MNEEKTLDQIVKQRLDEMQKVRLPYESDMKELANFVLNKRINWENDSSQYRKKEPEKTFDDTAPRALQTMADGFIGYMISPATRWIKLGFTDPSSQEASLFRDYLEKVDRHLYSTFSKTNFYTTASEMILDAGGIGNGYIIIEDDGTKPVYISIHQKECYISEDQFCRVDTLYREFYMTSRQLFLSFPNAPFPEGVRTSIERSKEDKHGVIHAIEKNYDFDPNDPFSKPWKSTYVLKDHPVVLKDGGYNYKPFVAWRWSTNSGEVYGRCPGHSCLRSIKALNKMNETLLQSAQLAVKPPITAPSEVKSSLDLRPSAVNFLTSNEVKVEKIDLLGNYPIGLDRVQHTKEMVEQAYHTDFFRLLSSLTQRMTTVEVMERQGEKASILASVTHRMMNEFLDDVIRTTLIIEAQAGRLPKPERDDFNFVQFLNSQKIEYIGMLPMLQKRYQETQSVMQFIQASAMLVQIKQDPSVLDYVDFDATEAFLARSHGIPEELILENSQVKKIREARQLQAQQQQKQMMMLEMAKIAKGNGQAPEPGSMGEQITGAFKR